MGTQTSLFERKSATETLESLSSGVVITSGPIIGYKAISCDGMNTVAQVEIPKGATICKPWQRTVEFKDFTKYRTDKYKILEIYNTNDISQPFEYKKCRSLWTQQQSYAKGQTYQEKVDEDVNKECSWGLHFFLTKNEAIQWPMTRIVS